MQIVLSTADEIVTLSLKVLTKWKNARLEERTQQRLKNEPLPTWIPPLHGTLKCNMDGSVCSQHDRSIYTAILRNDRRQFIMSPTRYFEYMLPVKMLKALALRASLV